ncbi:MAG: type III secretion system inner membrane ring subunit SctD [Succinivibrio sp.]|nr:type III secretion system inner membrane ring subunit SctD [Succinivibrio sp.]
MADDYSFKIYSGAHNGLVFGLLKGRYTLGSSDDNDLIFSDLSMPEQAAVLTLTDDNVELELLSDAQINGESVEAGSRLWTSGEFLQLGDTLICFRKAEIKGEWPLPSFKQTVEAPAEAVAETEIPAEGEAPQTAEEQPAEAEQPEAETAQEQILGYWERYKQFWPEALAAGVLVLLLFSLIVGPVIWGRDEDEHSVDLVQSALAAHNFDNVTVEQAERGVDVRGSVVSKAQYARLCEALPKLRTFLSLNVEVRDDEILSVERDFAALGYYVRARYIEDDLISVEGYFKDAYVQADAFRSMEKKYRSRLRGRAVYQPELSQALNAETGVRGLSTLKLLFSDGEVFYNGKTTIQDENDIELIRHATAIRLGIPLRLTKYDPKKTATIARFDGINVTEAAQTESELMQEQKEVAINRGSVPLAMDNSTLKEKVEDVAPQPIEIPKVLPKADPGFSVKDIMGVTLKPMRFITLKNGRKYFEGGVLPSGYTVSKIDLDKVVITKGQDIVELKITK